jgi:hypothetical protein
MFPGSIPRRLQEIMFEQVSEWDEREVWVGCSGNFTVERILGEGWKFHSNDVLIYSVTIGRYFAGNPLPLSITDDKKEKWGWLEDGGWMDTPEKAVATMMLVSACFEAIEKEKHVYFARMAKAYKSQWETLHEKTVNRLGDVQLDIKDMHCGDVYEWMATLDGDKPVIAYPPFVGGAGWYEKIFKKMDEVFQWDRPVFEELTEERRLELFEKIADRKRWAFASNRIVEGFEDRCRGFTKVTNRAPTVYVYSSGGPKRIVLPRQQLSPLMTPRLGAKEDLGENMTIKLLEYREFYHLRSLYMNPGIRPGKATLPVGVFVDGKLIGCFAYSYAPTIAKYHAKLPGPTAYLLSDFPINPTHYKKMSKLILYACMSQEAKRIVERGGGRFRSVSTTAYSKGPVSMKYRGIFKLLSRKENEDYKKDWYEDIQEDNPYYHQKWDLQYGNVFGQWTLNEGLGIWKKKHGNDKR